MLKAVALRAHCRAQKLGGGIVRGARVPLGSLARQALAHAPGLTPSDSRNARLKCGASLKPVALAASVTEEPRSSSRRAL